MLNKAKVKFSDKKYSVKEGGASNQEKTWSFRWLTDDDTDLDHLDDEEERERESDANQ